MRAEPLFSTGPVNLLNTVHLELKLDGKTIYSGRCRGDEDVNMIENALQLGEYKLGEVRVVDITLTVDPEMIAYEEESEAQFKWIFYAYRDQDSVSPRTGDHNNQWLYIGMLITGVLLFASALSLRRRHHTGVRLAKAF
jgi:LPXTG-motif cell wall-anchored protein